MAQEVQNGFEIPAATEQTAEINAEKIERTEPAAPAVAAPAPIPYVATAPAPVARTVIPKDPILIEVESVLSENIAELYKKLPAEKKQLFKTRGEQVATQINAMLKSGVMRIKKILEWIREWLQIIPGVNQFYLEQESKIKTDKIQFIYLREHSPAV